MQFRDDWPGLFVRGDDAIALMMSIRVLADRLSEHPDIAVVSSLARLTQYADVIAQDVIVHGDPDAEPAVAPCPADM